MAKKDFHLLLALENQGLQRRLVRKLAPIYSVSGARNGKDLAAKLRAREQSLVIVDHHFSGLEVESLQEKIVRFCPNVIYVVYSLKERERIARKLSKHRAIDYILYTPKMLDLTEKLHKAVRWTILQTEVSELSTKISRVAESIRQISQKIQKAY